MRITRIFQLLVIASLLLSFGGSPVQQEFAAKAQPQLAQMAAEQPEALVRVIVQQFTGASGAEDRVAALGGEVVTDLHIINAFAAEMTAEAAVELARVDSVRWVSLDGPMVRPSAVTQTVRDEFSSVSYGGNNGTMDWSSGWSEINETTSPTSGYILVRTDDSDCPSYNCVRMDARSGRGIYRQADLSAATSATLSFDFSRTNDGGTVAVQVSSNGGSSWATLESFSLNTEQTGQSATFDISAFKSSNTLIRFYVNYSGDGRFWFDNVQISYTLTGSSGTTAENYFLDTLRVHDVWDMGLQGQGVTVAVVDSGIANDGDFGNRQIRAQTSFASNSNTVNDIYGHGTHVAGIIGGNGTASGGTYAGVAPGVNLVSLKVNDGNGLAYESEVVAALQWIYDDVTGRNRYNIRVVNLSLNTTTEQSYHVSPLDAACEILWFNGIVVIASAGNKGSGGNYNTANASPANDPFIITVGASEEKGTSARSDDQVGTFSAFGLTTDGFAKPDIIAPGKDIYSILSQNSSWGTDYQERTVLNGEYFRLSGTSMAAPMVAGAVALLLQDEPNLTPDQVKYRLMNTGSTIAGSSTDNRSYPYLDVYAAITGTTTASANQGLYPSQLLSTGSDPIAWSSVGWNSVGWNSVGWNSVGWNSVGWNSVGWNSVGWNSTSWGE